jgi:hypothetical protein
MTNDQLKYQRSMDNALDHELPEAEWQALNAQVESSPEVADYWDRLQQVDHVLHATPMVGPTAGFSSRVMAAIAAMHLPEFANRRFGAGVALGLLAAALIALPVMSAVFILFLSVITDPGALNTLFQTVTSGASNTLGLLSDIGASCQDLAAEQPIFPALLTTVIPVSMLWAWLVWYLSGGSQLLTSQQVV